MKKMNLTISVIALLVSSQSLFAKKRTRSLICKSKRKYRKVGSINKFTFYNMNTVGNELPVLYISQTTKVENKRIVDEDIVEYQLQESDSKWFSSRINTTDPWRAFETPDYLIYLPISLLKMKTIIIEKENGNMHTLDKCRITGIGQLFPL